MAHLYLDEYLAHWFAGPYILNAFGASVARGDNRSRNGRPMPQTQPTTKPSADTRKVAMVSVRSLPFAAYQRGKKDGDNLTQPLAFL